MTTKRISRKNIKIIVKRQYVGKSDIQQIFTEVITRALLKESA